GRLGSATRAPGSGAQEFLPAAEPAPQVLVDERRLPLQQVFGDLARRRQQVAVALQVRVAQQRLARLARAEELAGAPLDQVATRDLETVGSLVHRPQALSRRRGQRRPEHQHAYALARAAPDPAAQLVQLREPETLRVLD